MRLSCVTRRCDRADLGIKFLSRPVKSSDNPDSPECVQVELETKEVEFKPEVQLPKGGWRLGQHKTVNSDIFFPSVLDDQGRLLATFYGSKAERNARLFVIAPEMVKNLIELELAFNVARKEMVQPHTEAGVVSSGEGPKPESETTRIVPTGTVPTENAG